MNRDQNLYIALKNIILNNSSVHIVIHKNSNRYTQVTIKEAQVETQ